MRCLVGRKRICGRGRIVATHNQKVKSNEGEFGGRVTTAVGFCNALEDAGIEFIYENGGGPGVRLRKSQRSKIEVSHLVNAM